MKLTAYEKIKLLREALGDLVALADREGERVRGDLAALIERARKALAETGGDEIGP